MTTTLYHGRSDADVCRERGWGPGTRLIGDEGYGPTVIEITAVGGKNILARCLGHDGGAHKPRESSWVLWCRDWREAREDEIPVPIAVGETVRSRKEPNLIGRVVDGPDEQGCYRIDCGNGKGAILPNPLRVQPNERALQRDDDNLEGSPYAATDRESGKD